MKKTERAAFVKGGICVSVTLADNLNKVSRNNMGEQSEHTPECPGRGKAAR